MIGGSQDPAERLDLRVEAAPTLRRQVADTLRAAIVFGELQPGERLVERVLCERTGVSRTSLREALRELENEGLVTMLPNRGLIVSTLDPIMARNIFDVRAALEGLVCRLFCSAATEAEMAECQAAFEAVKAAYAEGDARLAIKAKTRFYDALMAGAHNPEAERMLRSIHIRVSQLRVLSLSNSDRRMESLGELSDLLDALKARQGDRAESEARAHVDKAAVAALSRIGD